MDLRYCEKEHVYIGYEMSFRENPGHTCVPAPFDVDIHPQIVYKQCVLVMCSYY